MAGDETTQQLSGRDAVAVQPTTALTIIAHPEVSRVGEHVRLVELERGAMRVSRLEPRFELPSENRAPRALEDPFVSRSPAIVRATPDGLEFTASASAGIAIAGTPLTGTRWISDRELADGVTVEFGPRVALLVHRLAPSRTRPPRYGLVGESDVVDQLRASIARVAELRTPVLIRGETGVGKELVARALHDASGRTGSFVAVNVAAIPPTTASSALFGHVRGSFTGAVVDLPGHFRDADGGTLFLDEIGDIPLDVQATLLRAIESSEIQPVGGHRPTAVDVRIVAATDRDLEHAVASGRFRDALLHRLAGCQLAVPPLRVRRDDIARLLIHFVRDELAAAGRSSLLDDVSRRRPWLPPSLVAALVRYDWPGNVRQLRNVARQLALMNGDDGLATSDVLTVLGIAVHQSTEVPAAEAPTTAMILDALRRHKYSIASAASELGVSRTKMYTLAERVGGIRTAREVTRAEIEAALAACGRDLDTAAEKLRISPRALTLRMSELDIERT